MAEERVTATLDGVRYVSGNSDVKLTDAVLNALEFMRERGVKDFRVQVTK